MNVFLAFALANPAVVWAPAVGLAFAVVVARLKDRTTALGIQAGFEGELQRAAVADALEAMSKDDKRFQIEARIVLGFHCAFLTRKLLMLHRQLASASDAKSLRALRPLLNSAQSRWMVFDNAMKTFLIKDTTLEPSLKVEAGHTLGAARRNLDLVYHGVLYAIQKREAKVAASMANELRLALDRLARIQELLRIDLPASSDFVSGNPSDYGASPADEGAAASSGHVTSPRSGL